MELFHVVEEADAIVRLKGGVHKQVKVYRRGSTLFVPHSGGYIRIVPQQWDEHFGTGNPNVTVLEIEGPGITIKDKQLSYKHA